MKRPRLSFWQIWNMSFGFFGIQFGFALQNANVSRIFETLGASIDEIPVLWIAAPVTGLIVQPIIGHYSDKTWTRLGRRRPYFLVGAILASLALFVMPNSPTLWVAAGMLWIMDASINISMEPFRAFVGDMLPDEQRTVGFSMQSFFIGTGAVIASALPYVFTNWFGISNTAPEGVIPDSVKFSFYVGGAVFLASVVWTVFTTEEYPPEKLAEFDKENENTDGQAEKKALPTKHNFLRNGIISLVIGVAPFTFMKFDYGIAVFFGSLAIFGLLQLLTRFYLAKSKRNALTDIVSDLYEMPVTMKQLAAVQFFSWFALFAMWIYTTPAVAHHVFGASDTSSALYNEGADWVGVLMAVYNGFAAAMAFAIMWLAKKTSRKTVHAVALVAGALGLISFYFIKEPKLLLLSELGIGLAWASVLSMPYAILTGALPQSKLGVYMGIFNFFIVIPQITAAAILGFVIKNVFDGEAIYALLLGGISFVLAAALVLFVRDN